MTSDGTNTYAWDAENRLIKITYAGSGNYSIFDYDYWSHQAQITETQSSVVSSTRQFVWIGDYRAEERDGAGSLVKQFYAYGQRNGGTNYFYGLDDLDSVRTVTDASGNVQGESLYDSFGRETFKGSV